MECVEKINTMLYDLTNDLQIEMDWTKMMQLIDHISLSASSVMYEMYHSSLSLYTCLS